MAVTCGFFDSVGGDRKYSAAEMSQFYDSVITEGVFQNFKGGLAVSAGTGLSVSVAAGRANVQSRWLLNDAALTLSIDAASTTYGRIDAVVIRLSESSRNISIVVKKGTPASSPVAPSLTRSGGTYEMALAYVTVAANASSVSVTDKRSNSSLCGWAAVRESVPGEIDAQLEAMKTGFDGVEYNSPAEMVRGEDQKINNAVSDLQSDMNDVESDVNTIKNILDIDSAEKQLIYYSSGSKTVNITTGGFTDVVVTFDGSYRDLDPTKRYVIVAKYKATVKPENITMKLLLNCYKAGGAMITKFVIDDASSFAIPSDARGVIPCVLLSSTTEAYSEVINYEYKIYDAEWFENKSAYEFNRFDNVNGINNCAPFAQDNITTWKNCWQFCTFVNDEKRIMIGKRDIVLGSEWKFAYVGGNLTGQVTPDDHYTVVCAVDEYGMIHVVGNLHVQNLNQRYSRSSYALCIDRWEAATMTGISESEVTYPMFLKRNDGKLLLFYRNQGSGNGDWYINVYDNTTRVWTKLVPKLFDGTSLNPTDCMYPNHICKDKNGVIHMSGTFRVMGTLNINVFYAKSEDGGVTWKNSNNETYTLPMNRNSVEIVDNVPASDVMLNQNGMCADDDGNPHITYFKKKDGFFNIYHTYFDGTSWQVEKVTDFKKNISVDMASYKAELSRPSIVSYNNNVYIIYRQNVDGDSKYLLKIKEVSRFPMTNECSIVGFGLGSYEPTFDTVAAEENGVLSMLVVNSTKEITESIVGGGLEIYDDWKRQIGGVVTVKLKLIAELMNNEFNIPSLKVIKSTDEISGKLICGRHNPLFVKTTAFGSSANNDEASISINYTGLDSDESVSHDTIFFESTNGMKETPFVPFDSHIEDDNVSVSAVLNSGTLDAISIQMAVLEV